MTRFFCYNCYEEQDLRYEETETQVPVRGEVIPVKTSLPLCAVCGERVSMPASDNEILITAYREYRRLHGLLTPDEIVAIRNKYRLSQRALAKLLGWGMVTIHRYEHEGLPDASHNQILKSLRDPRFVLELLENTECGLSPVEKLQVRSVANSLLSQTRYESALMALDEFLASDEPSEYTGYRRPDPERLVKMAAYFVQKAAGDMFKVRLMKLLFYADFTHFANRGVSLSGFPYAAIRMGPVPDRYEMFLSWAQLAGYANVEFVETYQQPGEIFVPTEAAVRTEFTESELETCDSVLKHLGHLTGSQLAKLSHDEPAWQNTPTAERISYNWAQRLRAVPVIVDQ